MNRSSKSAKKTQAKASSNVRSKTSRSVNPRRDIANFFAKSKHFQERWKKIVGVPSRMRAEKISLQKAARDAGISPRTVVRWAAGALNKQKNGRYVAKKWDTLLRPMKVPTADGTTDVLVRGSRPASELASYWAAVQKFLATGDFSRLERFQDRKIKNASGLEIPLITDLRELKRLGAGVEFRFESIYARTA